MSDFFGLPTGILENDQIHLEYLLTAGPRIVRFSTQDGPNLLVELPDFYIDTTLGSFYFRGGHRLWCSPELLPDTYCPDNEDLVVENMEAGIRLVQPNRNGISKIMEIQLCPDQATVRLSHHLFNRGSRPVKLAPWAITMLPLGGTAILPQPIGNADPEGLLNNRFLALWPYTRLRDERLVLRDDYILIQAKPGLPPLKIGYYNPHGWLAYWRDGCLFRKCFDVRVGAIFSDNGCNAETYCNDHFMELESLGPLTILKPGEGVNHIETWELYDTLNVPFLPDEIRKTIIPAEK